MIKITLNSLILIIHNKFKIIHKNKNNTHIKNFTNQEIKF